MPAGYDQPGADRCDRCDGRDRDSDGLMDHQETHLLGSDPLDADAVADGLDDRDEVMSTGRIV